MSALLRRLEKLEQQMSEEAKGTCTCGRNLLVHYEGDSEAEPINCPRHGLQRVIEVSWVSPTHVEGKAA